MIIVSQDKTKITEKLELSVIGNEIYFECGVLGTYQTKERAKEVLQEIVDEYIKYATIENEIGSVKEVAILPKNMKCQRSD